MYPKKPPDDDIDFNIDENVIKPGQQIKTEEQENLDFWSSFDAELDDWDEDLDD